MFAIIRGGHYDADDDVGNTKPAPIRDFIYAERCAKIIPGDYLTATEMKDALDRYCGSYVASFRNDLTHGSYSGESFSSNMMRNTKEGSSLIWHGLLIFLSWGVPVFVFVIFCILAEQ